MSRSQASYLVAGIGIVALAVGLVALFAGADTAKYLAPLVLGGLLLVTGVNLDRLSEIGVSKSSLQVKFGLSKEAASVIERLDLTGEVYTYQFIHNHLEGPGDHDLKVRLQDALVQDAKAHAFARHVDKSDVATLFNENHPAARVLGIGLAQGNASLADADLYRKSIGDSKSGNEQYQGLVLAEANWPALSHKLRAEIVELSQNNGYIKQDPDRQAVAERIQQLWDDDSRDSARG